MARANSSSAGAFILAAATVMRSWLLALSAMPPPPATNSAASTAHPARLPSQVIDHEAPRSRRLVRPRSHPMVMNMVWPVNRSEPAKITNVSATANDAPMTTARIDGSAAAPTLKIRMMPSPT